MKTAVNAAVLLILLHCVWTKPVFTENDEILFKTWMAEHNKMYEADEYHQRLQIFLENKRMIDKHNSEKHSYTMGLNQFSDLTPDEFRKMYLMQPIQTGSRPRPDSTD